MSLTRWLSAIALLLTMPSVEVAHSNQSGVGPHPELPAPKTALIPTINVAKAVGWSKGRAPRPAPNLVVTAYATQLRHPRWLYTLPNGDVLVAETSGERAEEHDGGVKAWIKSLSHKVRYGSVRSYFVGIFQKKAGARVPSANRISLLRGITPDGSAALRTTFLEGLNSPFGMALVGEYLYVANTDALLKFKYHSGDTRLSAPGVKVADLPAGPINYHWTKNIIASRDGTKLYVAIGSNSNIMENGLESESNRAAILEVDLQSGSSRIFASGLRNPVGLAWQPGTDTLWTVVNERDELGDDLVPDYLTSLKEGGFYGWALQLLRPERRRSRPAATPRFGRQNYSSRLRARSAQGTSRPRLLHHGSASGTLCRRSIHWPAWLLESPRSPRLQRDLRAFPRWQAFG